jgi:predicted nucleic acid-binding protein
MIFDTDILIWIQRGNLKAAKLLNQTEERCISVQTYMELMQGAKSREHHRMARSFLKDFDFKILPFTENIGHRAAIYVEEYALGHGMRAADAIIAATATENNLVLSTSNAKHFQVIKDLKVKIFKP